jgi:hypothetical protein
MLKFWGCSFNQCHPGHALQANHDGVITSNTGSHHDVPPLQAGREPDRMDQNGAYRSGCTVAPRPTCTFEAPLVSFVCNSRASLLREFRYLYRVVVPQLSTSTGVCLFVKAPVATLAHPSIYCTCNTPLFGRCAANPVNPSTSSIRRVSVPHNHTTRDPPINTLFCFENGASVTPTRA